MNPLSILRLLEALGWVPQQTRVKRHVIARAQLNEITEGSVFSSRQERKTEELPLVQASSRTLSAVLLRGLFTKS